MSWISEGGSSNTPIVVPLPVAEDISNQPRQPTLSPEEYDQVVGLPLDVLNLYNAIQQQLAAYEEERRKREEEEARLRAELEQRLAAEQARIDEERAQAEVLATTPTPAPEVTPTPVQAPTSVPPIAPAEPASIVSDPFMQEQLAAAQAQQGFAPQRVAYTGQTPWGYSQPQPSPEATPLPEVTPTPPGQELLLSPVPLPSTLSQPSPERTGFADQQAAYLGITPPGYAPPGVSSEPVPSPLPIPTEEQATTPGTGTFGLPGYQMQQLQSLLNPDPQTTLIAMKEAADRAGLGAYGPEFYGAIAREMGGTGPGTARLGDFATVEEFAPLVSQAATEIARRKQQAAAETAQAAPRLQESLTGNPVLGLLAGPPPSPPPPGPDEMRFLASYLRNYNSLDDNTRDYLAMLVYRLPNDDMRAATINTLRGVSEDAANDLSSRVNDIRKQARIGHLFNAFNNPVTAALGVMPNVGAQLGKKIGEATRIPGAGTAGEIAGGYAGGIAEAVGAQALAPGIGPALVGVGLAPTMPQQGLGAYTAFEQGNVEEGIKQAALAGVPLVAPAALRVLGRMKGAGRSVETPAPAPGTPAAIEPAPAPGAPAAAAVEPPTAPGAPAAAGAALEGHAAATPNDAVGEIVADAAPPTTPTLPDLSPGQPVTWVAGTKKKDGSPITRKGTVAMVLEDGNVVITNKKGTPFTVPRESVSPLEVSAEVPAKAVAEVPGATEATGGVTEAAKGAAKATEAPVEEGTPIPVSPPSEVESAPVLPSASPLVEQAAPSPTTIKETPQGQPMIVPLVDLLPADGPEPGYRAYKDPKTGKSWQISETIPENLSQQAVDAVQLGTPLVGKTINGVVVDAENVVGLLSNGDYFAGIPVFEPLRRTWDAATNRFLLHGGDVVPLSAISRYVKMSSDLDAQLRTIDKNTEQYVAIKGRRPAEASGVAAKIALGVRDAADTVLGMAFGNLRNHRPEITNVVVADAARRNLINFLSRALAINAAEEFRNAGLAQDQAYFRAKYVGPTPINDDEAALIGTLPDVLQRYKLYALTPEELAAIQRLESENNGIISYLGSRGVKVRAKGNKLGIYLTNAYKEGGGRVDVTETRVYPTYADQARDTTNGRKPLTPIFLRNDRKPLTAEENLSALLELDTIHRRALLGSYNRVITLNQLKKVLNDQRAKFDAGEDVAGFRLGSKEPRPIGDKYREADVPGLEGYVLNTKDARPGSLSTYDYVKDAFAYEPGPLVRLLRPTTNFLRGLLSSLDYSPLIGIQGIRRFFANPVDGPMDIARGLMMFADERAYRYHIIQNLEMYERAARAGVNLFDTWRPSAEAISISSPATQIGKIWEGVENRLYRGAGYYKAATYNEALAQISALRGKPDAFNSVVRSALRQGLPPETAAALYVNNAFGGLSRAMLGHSNLRQDIERLLLFSPDFLRAQMGAILASPKVVLRDPEAYLTTRYLATTLLLTGGLAEAVSELYGHHANLTDPNRGDWLAAKTPFGNVSLMGPLRTYMQQVYRIAHDLSADRSLAKALNDAFFLGRTRVQPIISLATAFATNHDVFGNPLTTENPWSAKGIAEKALASLPSALPFGAQQAVQLLTDWRNIPPEQVATGVGTSLLGFNITPRSPGSILEERARARFGRPWNELSAQEKGTLLKTDSEAAQARQYIQQRTERRAEAGDVKATISQLMSANKEMRLAKIAAADEQFAKDHDRQRWIEAYRDAQQSSIRPLIQYMAGKNRQFREYLNAVSQSGKANEEMAALSEYLSVFDRFTDPNTGEIPLDRKKEFDAAISDMEKKLASETITTPEGETITKLDAVNRQLWGRDTIPASVQEYQRDIRALGDSGYFDRQDDAFAKFKKARASNALVQQAESPEELRAILMKNLESRGISPENFDRTAIWKSWQAIEEDYNRRWLVAHPEIDVLALKWEYEQRLHSIAAARLYKELTGLAPPIATD